MNQAAYLNLGLEFKVYSEADDDDALMIHIRLKSYDTDEYMDVTRRTFEAKITAEHGEMPLNIRTTDRDGDLILYLTRADVPTLVALGTPQEWQLTERFPDRQPRLYVAGKIAFDPAALLNLV